MNKFPIVARREFLSRVQKKTFLLSTIFLPLLIFGFYALIIYFAVDDSDKLRIAVKDEAALFHDSIPGRESNIQFDFVQADTATLRKLVEEKAYNGYLYIGPGFDLKSQDSMIFRSSKAIGLLLREKLSNRLNNALEAKRLAAYNISQAQLDSVKMENKLVFTSLSGSNESRRSGLAYGVGFVSGFLIYIVLFIYGTMVMRGVMEEKVSRIAEVIVSSVKPFQLMMGKITGIGAVGLVQFIIWGILIMSLQLLLPLIFPGLAGQMHSQAMQGNGMGAAQAMQQSGAMRQLTENLSQINFPLIIGCFLFYFLGGYLLYSSLFAAVGSSVNEDPQDAQTLLLPITMPIVFGIVIMMKAVNNPGSGIAVFGSLFPLTSPIVMMARIAHGIPEGVSVWELVTSMALLVGGFLFTTWLAAKIYRTGILLYGKKPTWKEMLKWAFRRN